MEERGEGEKEGKKEGETESERGKEKEKEGEGERQCRKGRKEEGRVFNKKINESKFNLVT